MKQIEIIEGTKLIAEFMKDYEFITDKGIYVYPITKVNSKGVLQYGFYIDEMSYHSSWDWLMPVVEKIETIKKCNKGNYAVIINGTLCQINSVSYIGKDKIEAVWVACVEFIKFYNQQKGE